MSSPVSGQEWDSDAVLAQVFKRQQKVCWARKMPDEIQKTIALIKQAIDEGKNVNRSAFRRILEEAIAPGRAPSREAVNVHFRGDCSCGKQEDT